MLSSVNARPFRHRVAAGFLWAGMLAAAFLLVALRNAQPVQAATACIDTTKLPGVTSDCKPTGGPAADELSTGDSTFWGPYLKSCSGLCVLKRGTSLCAALAKLEKKDGTWQCITKCDGEALSQSVPVAGNACLSGQFCCKLTAEQQAAAAQSAAKSTPVQKAPITKPQTLPDPLSGVNIPTLIGNVIRTFAGIAGSIALLMFVWGGISWILSGGEQAKVGKAKKTLVNAAIGLVLIFAAFTFVSTIIDAILAE